jgi:hypothetical protein
MTKKLITKKIMTQKNLFAFMLVIGIINIFLLSSEMVLSAPPLPTELYGTAKSYNQFIPSGTIVSVYDSDGNICGAYTARNTTWNTSYFGVLTCRGEDNYSVGPVEGEILQFRIGAAYASAIGFNGYIGGNVTNDSKYLNYSRINVTWESGSFKQIILVAPPLVCGDAFCDKYENCNTCPLDCNACPNGSTSNSTGNASNNGSTSGGGGGGGAGGGGGGTGGGAAGSGAGSESQSTTGDVAAGEEGGAGGEEPQETTCAESWLCGDWQECLPSNKQMRECADLNACGTTDEMPEIVQNCIYRIDIVVNETVHNETPIYVPPRKETPLLITVCKEHLKILSIPSLLFFILVMIILFIAESEYRRKIKHIDTDKKLDELKKLELKYIEYRKKVIFFVLIIVLSIIVYLYHYFFFLCQDKYIQYLWLLSGGILLVPIIVHFVLAMSKYSDSQKNRRLQTLNDIHYQHIDALREIANKELVMAEVNITSRIYELERKEEFNELLSRDRIVNKIYGDMTKLFNLYKTLKNPMNVEKDLLESIKKLDQDEEFLTAAKVHPELAEIRASLSALYSAYEYKQALYDEFTKIELEHGVSSPIIR